MTREVQYALTIASSKDGSLDLLHGPPVPVGQVPGQESAARYYPWGFDSRMPPEGQAVVAAPSGSDCSKAIIGARHSKFKPDADAAWTVIIYNEIAGTSIKLRSDGGVQITGKGASSEVKADGSIVLSTSAGASVELNGVAVKVNGGTKPVNRAGDPVIMANDFVIWLQGLASAASYPTPLPTGFGVTQGGSGNVTVP